MVVTLDSYWTAFWQPFPWWMSLTQALYLLAVPSPHPLSVDSRPRRENGSPGFDGFHLLGEQVETPPLTATSEVCQISILKLM